MFDATPDPSAEDSPSVDPTIRVCERHLRILEEVGEIALEVTRASGGAAVAGVRAAAQIVSPEEGWCSEIDKARAFAASKADSFQKTARALRLTLAPEQAIAMTGQNQERFQFLTRGAYRARRPSALHSGPRFTCPEPASRLPGTCLAPARTCL